MSKKTHEKELARARAKRQAERTHERTSRRYVAVGIVVAVAVAAVVVGFVLQGNDPADETAASPSASTTPSSDATPSAAASAPAAAASTPAAAQSAAPPPMVIDPTASYTATMATEKGDITLQLAADQAPQTVNNFVALSSVGFYDGVVFHRIQKEFVIQGGDPLGTGRGGPGYTFDDELSLAQQLVKDNDGNYPRGTLAMANAGPNTNGSQFFIVGADPGYPFQPNYTVFGKVTDGLDVVDAIAAGEVTGANQDQAVNPVKITGVTIKGPVDDAALADFSPQAG